MGYKSVLPYSEFRFFSSQHSAKEGTKRIRCAVTPHTTLPWHLYTLSGSAKPGGRDTETQIFILAGMKGLGKRFSLWRRVTLLPIVEILNSERI